ncbi:MarR family winged helix-turn-helix transcriptional regulator [Mobilicoccus caccae]|uniref:Transcriptional regulator n=1 Tax=Mobilicoccus caccae TaxID=1859295 RepID=A0ABQ6IKM2_9MICO|nr:MarR family transcriptional regulator [Mobilicoccus caccae]GMA38439.1 transcriptional regulator [Mobilicoccus caccae]
MSADRPADPRRGRDVPRPRQEWLTEREQRAWRAYLAGSRLLDDALDHDLQRHGLQLSEYEILALLSEADGRHLRMSKLADQVVQSRSRLTHTATRLERRALVQRRPAPGDGRGVDLWLTDEGSALLDRVAPTHVASVRRHLVDHLGAEGLAQLGAAMARIRDGILGEGDPASPRTAR